MRGAFLISDWVRQVNADVAPTMGVAAAMKRLHFEAEILVTAGLKSMVEQPTAESAAPKQIPFAEKISRMNQLKTVLVGVSLEGQNEPSNALIEECCQQFESRVLKYVEPAKCGSRESEIVSGKSDKKLRIDGTNLTVKETKTNPDEAVNTAYSLSLCFRRRGIAYEFANLISYSAHELYVEKLLRHLSTDAPPNYTQTTIQQVLRADQQVFVYLSANVKDIRPSAAGARPLDGELMNALRDYNTAFCLMPLPNNTTYQPWIQMGISTRGVKAPKVAANQMPRANTKDRMWHQEVWWVVLGMMQRVDQSVLISIYPSASTQRLGLHVEKDATFVSKLDVSRVTPLPQHTQLRCLQRNDKHPKGGSKGLPRRIRVTL